MNCFIVGSLILILFGLGKTELCKALARFLFDSEDAMVNSVFCNCFNFYYLATTPLPVVGSH